MITIRQSDLNMGCDRRFYLQHILGAYPQPNDPTTIGDPSAATIGTLAHAGMAEIYTNKGANAQDIRAAILEELEVVQEGRIPRSPKEWGTAVEQAFEMCLQYVVYLAESQADAGLTPVAVEAKLEHEIIPGLTITGTIDLVQLDEVTGQYIVVDHKTAAQMRVPVGNDFQLLTYSWLVREEMGYTPAIAQHNYLKRVRAASIKNGRAKPPFNDRVGIPITDTILDLHGDRLRTLARKYEGMYTELNSNPENHNTVALPNQTGECSWKCPMFDICPMMDDGSSNWRKIITDSYTPEETV